MLSAILRVLFSKDSFPTDMIKEFLGDDTIAVAGWVRQFPGLQVGELEPGAVR